MAWTCTLNKHQDILTDFEKHPKDQNEDPINPQTDPSSTSRQSTLQLDNITPTQDKGKVAATGNTLPKPPDPLKAMRQRQAAEAKLLATKARQ